MKKKVIPLLLVFFILWIPSIPSIHGSTDEANYLLIEEKLENIRSAYNIPTLHAGITRDTELVWTKGFGNQTALDTVFPIASIHKTFVGTAILQMFNRGLIDLDAGVSDYLPFEVKHHYNPEEAITIRMLLTHTSGLASELNYEFYWDTEGYFRSGYPPILNLSLGEYLNESFTPGGSNYDPSMWVYEPNERYSYSNPGFKLLHYLVEYVTGLAFEEYLQENIFEPCEMINSGINTSHFGDMNAIPYTRRLGINNEQPLYSSRMVRTTVTDLAHFLIAHLNEGSYGNQEILSPSTVTLMQKVRVRYSNYMNPILQDVNTYNFYQHSYGLGWSHFQDGFGGHGGSTPGFLSMMAGRKDSIGNSVGIILFMNVNAILGLNEDRAEVQSAYKELTNAILFELALVPKFNQEYIDLFVFFATIWLTIILLVHYGMRTIYKQKDPSKAEYSGGRIGYTILFLGFSLLGILNCINFFWLFDWVKLLLYLPIVSYLGMVTIHSFKDKRPFPPYFDNTKVTNVLQVWLVVSLLGLTLYNFTNSRLPIIIPTIFCLGSMLLILVDQTNLLGHKE
ncbi:MAG: serine hydrolase domain-containing protein [Candidatus Hodarchaeales archaeon]|jgi:CubicO group peptidase (beta-lactamase class C family)